MFSLSWTILIVSLVVLANAVSGFRSKQTTLVRNSRFILKALTNCEAGQFESIVLQSSQPVLVDFYANWCGPCKLVAPIFEKLAKEYPEDQLKFVKVDTDQHEEAVEQYKIQGLPLFGVFVRGKMVHSHSGALSSEQLRQFIAKGLQKTDIKM